MTRPRTTAEAFEAARAEIAELARSVGFHLTPFQESLLACVVTARRRPDITPPPRRWPPLSRRHNGYAPITNPIYDETTGGS